ncbi:MAG: response regulator transcription factor [Ardenticatenaceae bacterium]|nr:response regulator transcription factor [Ardenticatenaceae bacterium]
MTITRLLIVDDHTLFREGMSAILLNVPDIEVVGEAENGQEAIAQVKQLQPDVVLMDINMPDLNGIKATEQILRFRPDTGVIMLTMLENNDSLFAAMCAGARGYILKGSGKATMLKTIRAVAAGEAHFGPGIATRLTAFFQNGRFEAQERETDEPFPDLTNREQEILTQIAEGKNNQEIAEALHISVKTVSNHISNVFNKLQVTDRAQAIVKARNAGVGN